MSQPAKGEVLLSDFPGLTDTIDRRDGPPGAAAVQTNLLSRLSGQMDVRRGLREVTFEQ
jgi:hypothetical protein